MKIKNKPGISIIGAGRLGGALAIALARRDYQIRSLVAQQIENAARVANFIEPNPTVLSAENLTQLAPSEIFLIAVPDPEIAAVAALLAADFSFPPETVFLHTSGSLASDVLVDLKTRGAAIGSLHPLVSVSAAVSGAESFSNVYFCVEGDARAVAAAREIVADLNGNAFALAAHFKPLYHAAAVMTAGHLTALFDAAVAALVLCGLEKSAAQRILQPLSASVVENLKNQTPEVALTGTFARADLTTMRRHVAILRSAVEDENVWQIYRALGERSIALARQKGANAAVLEQMLRELTDNDFN